MSIQLHPTPHDEGRALVAAIIEADGRDQKDIARDADISEPHLTRLKSGERRLTSRMARRLGRVAPARADELADVAARIEDDTLSPPAGNSGTPGYLCQLPTIRRIVAAARTLAPTPSLKVA